MDMDSAINTEENNDCRSLELTETVPFTRDTDGSCVNGDWSADMDEELLAIIKEEPDDVCWIIYAIYVIFSS